MRPDWDIALGDDPVERYEKLIARGVEPVFAKMMANRRFPGIQTDATFMTGWQTDNQFTEAPDIGQFYRNRAIAAGVNPVGKRYLHQLAEFPGDPRAWVEGRGDVKKLCEERGYSCGGMVKVQSTPEFEDERPYAVSEDVVESHALDKIEKIEEDTGQTLTPVEKQDIKEQIREQITPKW